MLFNTTGFDLLMGEIFSYETFEQLILTSRWFAWGVLPYIAANVGFWIPVILLELANKPGVTKKVTYGKRRRSSMLINFHREKLSFRTQFLEALWVIAGPPMMLNAVFSKVIFGSLLPDPEVAFPDWFTFGKELFLLLVFEDFLLYWAHRAFHTWEFLWESHKYHHEITLTSAISTAHNDILEEAISGLGPVFISGLTVQPHPATYAVKIAFFISDLVTEHSGFDSFWVQLITLRFLPGRSPIAHHDHHHYYSKYMGKAKNFGHLFWVWDWAFGTLAVKTKRNEIANSS